LFFFLFYYRPDRTGVCGHSSVFEAAVSPPFGVHFVFVSFFFLDFVFGSFPPFLLDEFFIFFAERMDGLPLALLGGFAFSWLSLPLCFPVSL